MAAQPTVQYRGTADEPGWGTHSPAQRATGYPVVVGVDGSTHNAPAVTWAAEEAAVLGVDLVLVAVAPEDVAERPASSSPLQAAARATLERAARLARRERPGLAVRTEVRRGRPGQALTDGSAGLLVVGRRGSGGFARMPIGSTSLSVAGTAESVVVVISAQTAAVEREAFGQEDGSCGILAAVDPLAPEHGVLEFAFERAHQRALPLRVVGAWEVPPVVAHRHAGIRQVWQGQEEQVAAALEAVLTPWVAAYPDVVVERDVAHGHPAGTVLEQQAMAELTVLGRGGSRSGNGFRMGPITRSVLHLSTAPVAVVP